MEQRDYFLRQIEQMGKVLGKILARLFKFKSGNSAELTIESIEETFQNELELNFHSLISLPNDDFIEILTVEKQFDNDSIEKLADIFYEMIPFYTSKAKQKSLSEKALILHTYLEEKNNTFSFERKLKIDELRNMHF